VPGGVTAVVVVAESSEADVVVVDKLFTTEDTMANKLAREKLLVTPLTLIRKLPDFTKFGVEAMCAGRFDG
jgi:hypothetical protein